ncbi:dGTP triphosphohydrolase [Inquilinus limosus]|uniref:Deoxyguanosinetriphosphate triphosphohydrolase-like protein n=1 Tax=Inquilinus limosus TaxID=171674 RepID=A0A211ZFA3_9PROT|nr:dNTP triphosphohydrolase [Inquilinus limosus]OWJ63972.1 hypothetical protein BWR60_27100 [Inquilinus limosus]
MPSGDHDEGLSSRSPVSSLRRRAPGNSESRSPTKGSGGQSGGETGSNDQKINQEETVKSKALYGEYDWKRQVESKEKGEPWRSESRRDYARVIHSPAFRRLQGKTQLFPGHESDFFRNRLTHSLEVAQIAESIAFRMNHQIPYFQENNIDTRLCSVAGLIHDLGHPPFGHNGEHALDDKMKEYGGFEGNAQTLRIISRLEKKLQDTPDLNDSRVGLNLTYRTLAAALKYDQPIPPLRDKEEPLVKGYYEDDANLVKKIKSAVAPDLADGVGFKTIECAIMDIADDIAYSTYDLEDSLKAGFLTPASILSSDPKLLKRVALKVAKATNNTSITDIDVIEVFWDIFSKLSDPGQKMDLYNITRAFVRSRDIAESGYLRTELTTELVGEFINGVTVEINNQYPSLSKIILDSKVHRKVETLKNYTYEATIFSTRLKVAEFRGYEVVSKIFDALSGSKGYLLMPDDVRALWSKFESNASARMRVICDFVAGMTDRYALEFYARLHSDNPQSIFKPI